MRLRIQTTGDLPEIKAWYSTENAPSIRRVFDLKDILCQQLPPLKSHGFSGSQFSLLLDGFELLDDSPISVVRDEDLICIQRVTSAGVAGTISLKRKREQSPEPVQRRQMTSTREKSARALKRIPTPSSSSSSSSSSSDSDSDSSSSSSSSSSASSSSNSSSSSASTSSDGSSDDDLPRVMPSKPPKGKQNAARSRIINESMDYFVPPGHGKPATKLRNKRRRLKRQHEKAREVEVSGVPMPRGISSVNSVPLGIAESPPATNPSTADVPIPDDTELSNGALNDELMMTFMGNKNKKKGFKQSMSRPLPPKIVFEDNAIGPSTIANSVASSPEVHLGNRLLGSSLPARLIPPSKKQEKGELPPRLFVTSVDVEADISKAKRKGKRCEAEASWEGHASVGLVHENAEESFQGEELAGTIGEHQDIDWEKAEKGWDHFEEVKDASQLVVDTLVGWKSLALNPLTCSPEVMLFVGAVLNPFNSALGTLTVRLAPQPTDKDDMLVEEEYSWDEIQSLRWRIIALGTND